jgi:hypothetical protein
VRLSFGAGRKACFFDDDDLRVFTFCPAAFAVGRRHLLEFIYLDSLKGIETVKRPAARESICRAGVLH